MIDFYHSRLGGELAIDAWEEFFDQDDGPNPSPSQEEVDALVCYWFYAPWSPEGKKVKDPLKRKSLARTYLESVREKLPELKIRILEGIDSQPFSFFQVRDVEPGVSLTMKDLLLDEDVVVKDTQASHPGAKGRILYTRILTIDDTSIMMGCGPYPFDPSWISNVQDLRRWLAGKGELDRILLRKHESDLRNFYFQLRNLHLNPKPPMMCNTDGDPLEFQKLEWRLEIPLEEAIDPLLSLTLDTKEEVMSTAKKDGPGTLTWVEIHWAKKGNKSNKGMENTLLSRMELVPGKLTAEVNSQKRASKLKKEIEKRLGDGAFFEKAVIESFEGKMRAAQAKGPSMPSEPKDPEEEAAMEEALVEMQKRHWKTWIDEPLPALNGLTPKNAVKTKEGKELVEALLFSFEASNLRVTRPSLIVPVEELRKRLKL
jgi:hypothetical protein